MYVDDFLSYLNYEKNYSDHTIISYKKDLEQFFHFLKFNYEHVDESTMISQQIRDWIASLTEEGHKPTTVNRKLATIRSYFKYLRVNEIIDKNPVSKLYNLKKSKRIPTFVSQTKLNNVIDSFEENNEDIIKCRDYLLFELLYVTGMRRAELINLQESQIDFSNRTIKVKGKGGKERLIPLVDEIIKKVQSYIELKIRKGLSDSGFLFLTEKGKKIYPQLVYRIVKRILNQIKYLQKGSPHVLRHSFATHLLNNGADIYSIKELLGHSSLAATQVYVHSNIESLKISYKLAHPRA
jgi:integrase/recombinase XerC